MGSEIPSTSADNATDSTTDSDGELEIIEDLEDDQFQSFDFSKKQSALHAENLQEQAVEFVSKLKEDCNTTQVTVNYVVKGVDVLVKTYNRYVEAKILEQSDESTVQKKDVQTVFAYLNQQTIFEGVQTSYKKDKYVQLKWLEYVMPRRLVLTWKPAIVRGRVQNVPDKFGYYVKFLAQLEKLLQSAEILDCIDNPRQSAPDEFNSVLDGYYYISHPVTQKDPKAIAIILYLDDITPTESLSSYQDQALRNFTWTIGNVHPELRASIKAINILALCKASTAKQYRNFPFLQDIIQGINRLSSDQGVTFKVNGKNRVFHGFLVYCIGDHPANSNLAGFKESPYLAWRPCRQCMVSNEEMYEFVSEDQCVMRTAEKHMKHLAALEGTDTINTDITTEEEEHVERPDNPSKEYGVNFRSPLLDLDYYDISKCHPQDVMHLFLEGILELQCRLLLRHAVTEKKLSLKKVNEFISSVDLGALSTDRPSPITSDHLKNGLRQSSSQTLMLSSLLPFIVKGYCDKRHLRNFISLLTILGIALSRRTKQRVAFTLKKLITKYLIEFKILYPGCFMPKHHFLLHLCSQLGLFGNLTEQWAMRFEAFHAQMKRLTKIMHSASDASLLLINRLCNKKAIYLHYNSDNFLHLSNVDIKLSDNKVPVMSLEFKDCIFSALRTVPRDAMVSEVLSLKWYGTDVRRNTFLLVENPENSLPVFGAVCCSYSFEDQIVIVYRKMETSAFCEDLNAYLIRSTQVASFGGMNIMNNFDLSPLIHLKFEGCDYIIHRRNSAPDYEELLL